jgi:hypothetical protein
MSLLLYVPRYARARGHSSGYIRSNLILLKAFVDMSFMPTHFFNLSGQLVPLGACPGRHD